MKGRNILLGAGAAIACLALYTSQKVKKLQAAFNSMTIKPTGISELQYNLTFLSFKLNFKIENNSPEDFSVDGFSVVTVKRVVIFRNGNHLATGYLNVEAVEIPAYTAVEVQGVPFSVTIENVLYNLILIENLSIDQILSQMSVVVIVDVMGSEYSIKGD